ncbi:MAG: porin [Rhodospirillales bacterium]|nr:porin [Rhodospirillales bacterium]
MKRVLLATTALVAAGGFAAAAQAQDMMVPMEIGVGGYYTIAAIGYDEDGANDRGHGINQNMEMQLRAEATLDNGITSGVRVRFTANDYEHSDEQEVYFKGGFGSLHIGAIEGAAQQTVIWAPGGSVPIGGIKSPWFRSIGAMWTNAHMNEDALKVLYFSPVFNGISLAASYAPEDNTNSYGTGFDGGWSNDSRIGYDDDDNPTYGDSHHHGEEISVALSYSVDVMGGTFSANVGYDALSTESLNGASCVASATQVCDPDGLRYGASVSIDQIAIGGAVYQHDAPGGSNVAKSDFGVSWTDGPMMLGVQYGDNESNNSNIVAFNANYNLGPGIDLGMQIGAGEKGMNDFTQVLLGTMLNF